MSVETILRDVLFLIFNKLNLEDIISVLQVSTAWRSSIINNLPQVISRPMIWKNSQSNITYGIPAKSVVQIALPAIPIPFPFGLTWKCKIRQTEWVAVGVCGAEEEGLDGFNRGAARRIWGWSSNGCFWINGLSHDRGCLWLDDDMELDIVIQERKIYIMDRGKCRFSTDIKRFSERERLHPMVHPMVRMNSACDSVELSEITVTTKDMSLSPVVPSIKNF